MKKIIYFILIIFFTFSFSCKKAEVRKKIEGFWKIDNYVQHSFGPPYDYTGSFEFGECSRKNNRDKKCKVIEKLTLYNSYYDTTLPETIEIHDFEITDKGDVISFGGTNYSVNLNGDELTLSNILETRGLSYTYYLIRQ